jgi:hypothetical protein
MDEMLPPAVGNAPPTVSLDRVYATGAGAVLIVACITGVWVAATPHPLWKLLTVLGYIPLAALGFVRLAILAQQRGAAGPMPFVVKSWYVRVVLIAGLIPLAFASWYGPLPFAHQLVIVWLAVGCFALWRAGKSEAIFACQRARPATRLDREDAILLGIIAAFFLTLFEALFWLM